LKLFVLLAALAAVPACHSSGDPAGVGGEQALSLTDIPASASLVEAALLTPEGRYADLRGYSGITRRERAVVRDEASWRVFWRRAAGGRDAPAPAVNFASDVVIFAALGELPSGGHFVEIDRVYRHEGDLYAVVTEHAAAPTCPTPQPSSMQPIVAVRVAAASGARVRFVERSVMDACG